MKKTILLSTLLLTLGVNAQEQPMRERLVERLNLDAEQTVQFDAIMETRKLQIEEINQSVDAQLAEILSDEQYAEWKSLQERRKKPRRRR
ncbi:hypothetical protein [Marinicella sp. W31]|uniref:hypothetical protein n=1 Tax=Marinicella sp. W31 TaxID=3023713 RepID=UPI003757F9BB